MTFKPHLLQATWCEETVGIDRWGGGGWMIPPSSDNVASDRVLLLRLPAAGCPLPRGEGKGLATGARLMIEVTITFVAAAGR